MTIDAKPSLGKSTWRIGRSGGPGKIPVRTLGIQALVLAAIAAIGCLTWILPYGPSDAQNQAVSAPPPVMTSEQDTSLLNPAITPTQATLAAPADEARPAEAITPEETAPVDGLRISSQSWRRGGLGSN